MNDTTTDPRLGQEVLHAALGYAARGWHVFPCKARSKMPLTAHGFRDATIDGATIRRWWDKQPHANVAIATGATSGLVVLDVDLHKGGLETLEDLEEKYGKLPDTIEAISGGGGRHIYLRHPGDTIPSSAGKLGSGLDIRGDGGYIVVPPSLHPTERRYEWEISSQPADVQLAPMPQWLLRAATRREGKCLDNSGPIEEHRRNGTLTRLAGAMRRPGMSEDAILAALLKENELKCKPPLDAEEVQEIAKSVGRYDPAPSTRTMAVHDTQPKPSIPWPEPLAEEAFHGLVGDVVRAIDPVTEADPAAILINFLTMFGSAVGRGPHAVAEDDRHGCNLHSVQVGDTAKGRKGSAFGRVRRLFYEVDPVWTDGHITSGLSSGEGLIWAVRDPIEKVIDGEVKVVDPGVEDKRLLVFEPEFSAPLKVMAREGNTLSATLRQTWDSGTLRILTKNSPARATAAHVGIIGHITKDELVRYLNDIEAGNGFANRFLWVCVRRSKVLPEGGGQPDYRDMVPRLRAALEKAREIDQLKWDAEAWQIWVGIYPGLSEGKPGLFGAVTARAEAQVLRLSVLYAALDGDCAICPVHLMAALAIWEFCEVSARYIFGDALGDPVADRVLAGLRQSPDGLKKTDIHRLFSRHASATRIDQALGLLLTAGRVQCEPINTDGRPVEVWRAVRSLNSLNSQERR